MKNRYFHYVLDQKENQIESCYSGSSLMRTSLEALAQVKGGSYHIWDRETGETECVYGKSKPSIKSQKFYNIHSIINANATEMVDGSKWITWAKARLDEGLNLRRLNRIADLLS